MQLPLNNTPVLAQIGFGTTELTSSGLWFQTQKVNTGSNPIVFYATSNDESLTYQIVSDNGVVLATGSNGSYAEYTPENGVARVFFHVDGSTSNTIATIGYTNNGNPIAIDVGVLAATMPNVVSSPSAFPENLQIFSAPTFNDVYSMLATQGIVVEFTSPSQTFFIEQYNTVDGGNSNGSIALYDQNKQPVLSYNGDIVGYVWHEYRVVAGQKYYAVLSSPVDANVIIADNSIEWGDNLYSLSTVRPTFSEIQLSQNPTVDTLIQDALDAVKTYVDTQDASVKAYADNLISQLMNTSDLTAKLELLNQINDILDGDAANAGFQAWQSSLSRLTTAEGTIVTNKAEAAANLLSAFSVLKSKAVITFAV